MLLKLKASSGLPLRMEASTSPLSLLPSPSAWHWAGRTGATLVRSTHVYFRMAGHSGVLPLRQPAKSLGDGCHEIVIPQHPINDDPGKSLTFDLVGESNAGFRVVSHRETDISFDTQKL